MMLYRLTHISAHAGTLLLAFMLTLAIGSTAFGSTVAFADEDDSDNTVNTQQLPDNTFLYETTIDELASADTYYDGQVMQVTGEVVGDELNADTGENYCWITLASDDGNATLAVYMTKEAAKKIDSFGSYAKTGTTLQVHGTFNLACPDHAGSTDLHADIVSVTLPGSAHADVYDFNSFVPGIIVVAIGVALFGLFWWARDRRR